VSELSCQARPVCSWATLKSRNLTMREIVDLTGLADLLDRTRREGNEQAGEKNSPTPVDIVQGSQIWYGDDVRNWARESGRLQSHQLLEAVGTTTQTPGTRSMLTPFAADDNLHCLHVRVSARQDGLETAPWRAILSGHGRVTSGHRR